MSNGKAKGIFFFFSPITQIYLTRHELTSLSIHMRYIEGREFIRLESQGYRLVKTKKINSQTFLASKRILTHHQG